MEGRIDRLKTLEIEVRAVSRKLVQVLRIGAGKKARKGRSNGRGKKHFSL